MKCSVIYPDKVDSSKGGLLSHVDGAVDLANLNEFADLAILTHIAPGVFRDNKKRQDHLESIGFICFDFDDGRIGSYDVHQQLKRQANHVILASKSNLVDKGDGKGEIERFHVFIPTSEPITDVEFYKYVSRKFAKLNLWSVDENCLEPSRYFYQHSGILHVYTKAEPLTLERFRKLKELDEKKAEKLAPVFFTYDDDTPAIDKFKRTKYFRMLESGSLKTDGNRYNVSCKIIGTMKVCGLNPCEAIQLFDQYSNYGKSFTRESIVRRLNDFGG